MRLHGRRFERRNLIMTTAFVAAANSNVPPYRLTPFRHGEKRIREQDEQKAAFCR